MFKIFKFNKVRSTNEVAINLIRNKKINKGIIVSQNQSKGRGTRGKLWVSLKGNLFFTIFFQLNPDRPKFYEFSIINPILIISVIKKFYRKKNIYIKWPNDILIGKKKVCGILQEIISYQKNSYLIIGIGINLNSNPTIKEKLTTCIYHERKKLVDTKKFLKYLAKAYNNFFLDLKKYNFSIYKNKSKILAVNKI